MGDGSEWKEHVWNKVVRNSILPLLLPAEDGCKEMVGRLPLLLWRCCAVNSPLLDQAGQGFVLKGCLSFPSRMGEIWVCVESLPPMSKLTNIHPSPLGGNPNEAYN